MPPPGAGMVHQSKAVFTTLSTWLGIVSEHSVCRMVKTARVHLIPTLTNAPDSKLPVFWLYSTCFLVWKPPGSHDQVLGGGGCQSVHRSPQAHKQVHSLSCDQGKTAQTFSSQPLACSTEAMTCFLGLALPPFPHSLIVQPYYPLMVGPGPGKPQAR